mgnify:CR=1 FL=1
MNATPKRTPASRHARLEAAARTLQALDPGAVMRRGFAIVRDERERLVTDAAELARDQSLSVELARGRARVRVQSTQGG